MYVKLLIATTPLRETRLTRLQAAGANLMGSDLYNKLTKYLVAHLKTTKEVS